MMKSVRDPKGKDYFGLQFSCDEIFNNDSNFDAKIATPPVPQRQMQINLLADKYLIILLWH